MKISIFSIKLIFLLIIIINVSKQQRDFLPETFKEKDLIFPENDVIKKYDFNLIEAKVLTKEEITLYLNNQGIHLTVDDCCKEETDFNAWTQRNMNLESNYEEIYTNAKYIGNNKKITYKFPISRIDNRGYSVHHRVWIFEPRITGLRTIRVYLNNIQICFTQFYQKIFVELDIWTESEETEFDINYENFAKCLNKPTVPLTEDIKTITFEFPYANVYSPAIALHWTYYKIKIAYSNFSLKGNSLCDKITNPCISGYFCVGGVCKKCHPSCYDCVNGALSTDCYSKCNTHSSLRTPDKGTCTIGYVDLNAFDDFDIEDIIPPPRNNRLTISFWMYLNNFPQESVTAYINNSFSENINFFFDFTNNDVTIKCAKNTDGVLTVKNSWFFVKCAVSFDHEDTEKDSLYIKYFDGTTSQYYYKQNGAPSVNRTNCGHDFKKYYEPDDYISLHFYKFNQLRHDEYTCNVYMKQLVLFREFLPEPYDNKYFSVEKLLTSTLDLPEVLFVIPFDELKRESNKYKIKCYSYPGDIEVNEIILSPKETGDPFSLFPPRLFKRLNLLEKNTKFTSPDLVHTSEIVLANNALIGSYDNVPLSCNDNYFLTFTTPISQANPNPTYMGTCDSNCQPGYTTIFGLGDRKGFCNRNCADRPNDICLSSNDQLLHLQTEFKCQVTDNYYDTFYYCEEKEEQKQKENIFYYDPHFTPGNIVIDVRNYNLKSYIIEYWYNPVDCGRITSGYTFYTNQFQIKNVETSFNVYTTAHGSQGFTINDIYFDKWNHILFEVYYDPREERNYKTRVFMETSLNSGNAQLIDHSENPYPLDYIYFCNGRRASCNNIELNWFCGYYRNLRLFNGNLAQRHVTFRYDEYYKDILYLSSIVFYYPLYGSYIANNRLEQFNREKSPLIITSATNNWNFPQYNYCKKTDYITGANLVNNNNDICTLGFNNNNEKCYECKTNNFLKKEKGGEKIKCEANKKYVLKLPSNKEFEMDPYNGNYKSSSTITFFIKVYGFSETGKIDIIYLSDHLKLSYNSNFDDIYFGLNLVTFTGTQEVIVSNYYNFRKHFGLWTFISVATYNEADENYFPPMVRFEINHKKMPIVGPLDNLTIKKIHFSNKVYALVQKVKVYNTYFIGAHSYEINTANKALVKYDVNNDLVDQSYFEPQNSATDCTLDKFNLGSNSDIYNCVPDDDDLLYFGNRGLNTFYEFESESNVATSISNCNGECDICIGSTRYDCSCNFKNNEEKLFLGNVSNHYCKKFDYTNFAKATEITTTVPVSTDKFTLHFWAFAYSYVDKVFEGFEIEWQNHVTVKVYLDSTRRYNFNCVINGNPTDKLIDFNMNTWNFLHCAVSYLPQTPHKLFITTEEDSFEIDYYGDKPTISGTTTNLIIRDLTTAKDWGVLFYKYIRIWKNAFQYSSFLSRIEIIQNYFNTDLLRQWNTAVDINNIHKVKETNGNADFIVEYEADKIGTNIVPEEVYQEVVDKPILCNENGEYYDRKSKGCIKFTDISNINEDPEIKNIDVAYSHNYGMAFWILMEDSKSIVNPINFIWQYHMQVSLQFDTTQNIFKIYCFPQNYFPYSKILDQDDKPLDDKVSEVLNSVKKEYDYELSGYWTWVQCSLSYNNRYFYLNDIGATLIAETLYKDGGVEKKNDEPLGYFYNGINEDLSYLKMEITKNNASRKKIYLRCFYLFKDYLPYNYNFKYMDMYRIDKEQFPPLTFAINFAELTFNPIDNSIVYKSRKYSSLENLITPYELKVTMKDPTSKELAANFVFLPLCDPLKNEKFDADKQLCQEINDCDPNALNCLFCMDEKTPLVCKTNYYINIDDQKNEVECLNYCRGSLYRSPGTLPTQGICGTDCVSFDILMTCPNTASSILTYQNDFACKTGYTRIGYQCFDGPTFEDPNPGALFYSGINYPYNIYQSFTNDFISLIGSGYVLEFWFMIDNVIMNQTNFVSTKKYHYFNAKPHDVYIENQKYFYRFSGKNNIEHKKEITDLVHQYEWNRILIFADATISGKKEIRVVVNFDKVNTKKIDVSSEEITLTYIAFCSNDPDINLLYPECVLRGNSINWASAYYNNIRIWSIKTSTIETIQSYINGIYTENPQSIILFYPLTIKYIDNNVMTNIMGNLGEHISFKCASKSRCTLYNRDNIIIYNYSSKFDWGLLHKKHFVEKMDGDFTLDITSETCDNYCLRCYEKDKITNCYECAEGFVLQYKECKNATQYYFLKTPSSTRTSYDLQIEYDQEKSIADLVSFTLVFWIKFFGVEYSTVTEYCKILSLDSNTYLAFQRSTNNLIVLENSKIVFRDTNFNKYFGIWIPISIANYKSNAQSEIYPNMFTLSVNRIDIPFSEGYSLPSTGIKVTQLQLGYEIIALFAELRIYNKFFQGGYGKIRAPTFQDNLIYYKSLIGTSTSNCVGLEEDLIGNVGIVCAPDYSLHFNDTFYCNDAKKFYSPYNSDNNENADKCGDCHQDCNTLCFLGGEEECTCDMTDGIFWLRRNVNMQTYCEHIPYFDFGNIKPYTFTNAPMSETKEYTIEFWLFVYSYNQVTMNFKTMWVEWNYHNRLKLYNEQNSLKVDCQPIWRSEDFPNTIYPDIKQGTLKYYQWNYVRCGTDLKNKKYFLNTITEYDLKAKEEYFFDLRKIDAEASEDQKYFSIYRSSDFYVNFGYVFMREIKLWRQYNLDYLDSQYIYFDMSVTTVDDLKTNFPGLLLYYKNEFNLNEDKNPVITEILTNTITVIGRDPDYVGYNVVDPNRAGYAPLLKICPYGQVYDELLLEKCKCAPGLEFDAGRINCLPTAAEQSSLCEIYSNLEKRCFQCKEENVYINKWRSEFDEECYNECPETLFEDPLMNQCRRCHETCYECTNENYNDCTSCTGELYFNFKENTCIPNCQTAGLTRSLTKPNICVIFDADASLVNVDSLTPIDVNTFDYIEAIVIQPTSPEYKTLWLFDANQTNIINTELGFTDTIPLTDEPFTGDKTQLKTDLDHNFFKVQHKYVFGLKIYVENEGIEVPVFVWWTLTMNAPPFGGKVTVMPYLGLYNTTTFIMRCVDFLDENTPQEELEYDFYYVEVNTNSKIKLSNDFSLNNEVYSNFTVRYYQLEYSNITIYCQVRDKFGAISEASNVITIVNKKNSPLYILKQLVASFTIVDDALTDIQLLARAEVLMSLGINPYNDRVPSSYFTTYESSLTGEKVEKVEPICVTGYCNDNGDCEVIDVALTCKCIASYIGKECFLDKDGYSDLAYYYKKLYQRLLERIISGNIVGDPINDIIFKAFYRLFFAAQNFFQDDTFFENNLIELKNFLKQGTNINYITANEDRINKLLDFDEFFFNYFYIKESQLKLGNKINENYPFRNKTLTLSESSSYQTAFETFFEMIDADTVFIIQNYKKDYDYTSPHFIYHLKQIDENFDDQSYFESLKSVYVTYKPTVLFMNCLKQKISNFNDIYYLNYIEYLVHPMSYDSTFYPNITSPFISIKIYDKNGFEVPMRTCYDYPIRIYLPFNSYDWMTYINEQKWLFLPENYKLENDPVFRDPILIWDNGSISDDNVEQRIEKYYRYYNIVGLVHTPTSMTLYEYTSFMFKNISDSFFLIFETNHLSSFTSMLIPNIMNFVVDGRFYYLPRYKVLFCFSNHVKNPAFYIWASFLFLFIFISIVYKFYDFTYFDQLDMLDFLRKEIFKAHFPYDQIDPGLNDENYYKKLKIIEEKTKKRNRAIKKMFNEYDMDDVKENEESEEFDDSISEQAKSSRKKDNRTTTENNNEYTTSRNHLMSRKNTNSNKEQEMDEKATGIKTYKSKKNKNKNKDKKEETKDNPPKRNNRYFDQEEPEYTLQYKNKLTKKSMDDNVDIEDINKTYSKSNKLKGLKKEDEDEKNEDKKDDYGYDDLEEDFNENQIENYIKSEKHTIKSHSKGSKQNFDLQALNSKYGLSDSKFSSKYGSKYSGKSKKSYFYDKYKTKSGLVALEKFHNRAGRTNVDNDGIPLDIINEEEERKKALEAYTRLSVTPFQFFLYNVKARHILIAPFLNLTLFNNRWKKLMVLLTQVYTQQLIISIYLTMNEKIISSNFGGIIETSLISSVVSNLLVYCYVFLFGTSTYQRKRLYRLVINGETLIVEKAWRRLKRTMNFSIIFGIIIAVIIWAANLYITLIFTAVWWVQRSAWILSFFLSVFIDLVIGELLIEGLCAFLYSNRVKYDCMKNLGESLNRLRSYRTMWP